MIFLDPVILDVIPLVESSLQTTCDTLNEWSSPYLRKCSFACVAKSRDTPSHPSASDLDCILPELSRKLDFQGFLIPGKQLATEWPEEPHEDDFATPGEFDAAYDAFWPKQFDPKPWLVDEKKVDVERTLLDSMKWSINNKRYELKDAQGQKRYVAFSHQDDEKRAIADQEAHHQSMVNKFASNAAQFFANDDSVSLFRSNHQLEIDIDDSVAECYEGCFFDRTLAFVSDARVLMVWIGHLRWYG